MVSSSFLLMTARSTVGIPATMTLGSAFSRYCRPKPRPTLGTPSLLSLDVSCTSSLSSPITLGCTNSRHLLCLCVQAETATPQQKFVIKPVTCIMLLL